MSKSWRPENWYVLYPNECIGCTNKVEDEWGKVCDLSCGKYSARVNFEAGADAFLQALCTKDNYMSCIDEWEGLDGIKRKAFKGWLIAIPDDDEAVEAVEPLIKEA